MNHPTLKGYTLIEQLDYVDYYSSSSGDTLIAQFRESSVIDLEMAKESLDLILKYKKDRATYGITDARAQFLDFKTEAKNYYREHMVKGETLLHAIVVKDLATKILANIYARFDTPKVPTRVFTSLNDAIEWIEDSKF